MNRPLRKIVLACAALFLVLLVNANVVQVVEASSLTHNQHNSRVLIDSYNRQRGDIIAGGEAVARSDATSDSLTYLRTYPGGKLFAPITGYYSINLSDSDVERSENSILDGSDSRISISFSRITQLLSGRTPQGGIVTLTIDRNAQAAAAAALGNRRGAVVALDPRTGAVLALVTSPSYDPSLLSTHDTTANERNYQTLLHTPGNPLLDRATDQLYPPGSTFKLIDTAAALSVGGYTPQTLIPAPASILLPDTRTTLGNFAGESCGGASITLTTALAVSCNTAFADLGISLKAPALQAQAEAFGFGQGIDGFPLPYARSVFPADINAAETAQSSIGQFDVKASPLQMAMVAAAIANGGTEMKPYVVAEEQGPDLKVLSTTGPQKMGQPITAQVAGELTTMMEQVVTSGTGKKAQIPGVAVAGKTGTADNTGEGPLPDSWFVAFAPAEAPTVALAVLVEQGGGEDSTGGAVAAPIAKTVITTLLAEHR